MSQRRGGGGGQQRDNGNTAEELVPFNEVLDLPKSPQSMDRSGDEDVEAAPQGNKNGSSSMDERYEIEAQNLKKKLWKEHPFACGLTEPTWTEEYHKFKQNPMRHCSETAERDGIPCICCSAAACSMLGAGRVGNMAILKQSTEWVEEVDDAGDGSEPTVRRFTRPRLDIVVGPYWPMLLCVTYPLIFGVSIATLVLAIPKCNFLVTIIWAACTLGLIYALAMTAFRDPGILPKHEQAPPQNANGWLWSDRAYSWRPRGAFYDTDTGVVVEEFDHTCPWTGTAIGKKNMFSFQWFVALVFICLVFDIFLLTGGVV